MVSFYPLSPHLRIHSAVAHPCSVAKHPCKASNHGCFASLHGCFAPLHPCSVFKHPCKAFKHPRKTAKPGGLPGGHGDPDKPNGAPKAPRDGGVAPTFCDGAPQPRRTPKVFSIAGGGSRLFAFGTGRPVLTQHQRGPRQGPFRHQTANTSQTACLRY